MCRALTIKPINEMLADTNHIVSCHYGVISQHSPADSSLHMVRGARYIPGMSEIRTKGGGRNNIYIRPHLGHHFCVAFLGKGATIICETRLAVMAQARPRC
jgi:hypothetical protein